MTDQALPTVDVFTAGCPLCDDTVAAVRSLVGDAAEVRVLDTHDADVARLARELGLGAVPAVVVEGEPASCCGGLGPDEADLVRTLREAGIEPVRAAATSDDSPEAHDAPEADDSADDAPAARSGCC
jgi:hypothetical protein